MDNPQIASLASPATSHSQKSSSTVLKDIDSLSRPLAILTASLIVLTVVFLIFFRTVAYFPSGIPNMRAESLNTATKVKQYQLKDYLGSDSPTYEELRTAQEQIERQISLFLSHLSDSDRKCIYVSERIDKSQTKRRQLYKLDSVNNALDYSSFYQYSTMQELNYLGSAKSAAKVQAVPAAKKTQTQQNASSSYTALMKSLECRLSSVGWICPATPANSAKKAPRLLTEEVHADMNVILWQSKACQ